MTPKHPYRRRLRDTIIPLAWLFVACVIIGTALAGGVKAAPADPAADYAIAHAAAVCSYLDAHPTIRGVNDVLNIVADSGLSDFNAGGAVALSVLNVCPIHRPLLDAYVGAYSAKVKAA
jgi:hypothetical protein